MLINDLHVSPYNCCSRQARATPRMFSRKLKPVKLIKPFSTAFAVESKMIAASRSLIIFIINILNILYCHYTHYVSVFSVQ